MIYTFLSSIFITLFLLLGAWSLLGFYELMKKSMPLNWCCYQHVILLAVLAALCLILSVIFGLQIPDCHVY